MSLPGPRERWSDRELLSAIAARDGAACAVFYRRHLARTVAFLMRETHDPEVAADVTAEVFAAVIVNAGRYRPQGDSAAPWVIGIARNTLGASRRRGRVEAQARRRLAMEPIDLDDRDLEETEAVAAGSREAALELVAALPEDERLAVEARFVHERSYSEIAAEIRVSELVVRKRVSRGLGRVRKRLERE
jgi:RNA polymerase sigma-70 factor (ECF subfamily)